MVSSVSEVGGVSSVRVKIWLFGQSRAKWPNPPHLKHRCGEREEATDVLVGADPLVLLALGRVPAGITETPLGFSVLVVFGLSVPVLPFALSCFSTFNAN